jgi:CubicO group peptidase (beta-lactamase class C family)
MRAAVAEGTVEPRFEPVREVFEQVLDEHDAARATGAGVAVRHQGRWVVDLWGGYADAARTRPWRRDTLVMPYSVTKPFAAVCALVLADRGVIDLDAPLTRYWPELTARTTMRQVLCHESGLVLLSQPAPEEAFYDWDLMCTLLAVQQPLWEPGTACGESALLYGHQIGEVVRRTDGRTLGRFLREEVCGPHGIDFAIGLSVDELERTADLTGFDDDFRRRGEELPVMQQALANPPGALDAAVVNSARWRTAEVPAVNGHGTARGVAGLLVAVQQGDLLSTESRRAMTSVAASGVDRVLGEESRWGLGVGIDDDGYGMGGLGGSVAWCSTEGGYVLGFVTGRIADYDRVTRIDNAVRGCVGLSPL